MKMFGALFLALVVLLNGMPLSVFAQESPTVFAVPDGIVGKPYRTNIATVLREKYQLRLETDSRASLFRWSVCQGDVPPGLVVRANGTIVGSPRVARADPYRFQLKVVDLSTPQGAALTLDFSLAITAPRIRLAHVNVPKLVPTAATSDRQPRFEIPRYQPFNTSQAAAETPQETNFSVSASSPANELATRSQIYASMLKPKGTGESSLPVTRAETEPGSATAPKPNPVPVPTPKPTVIVVVSKEQFTGDKVRGPATIELQNLNILRYDIKVGKDVTFSAGPDLTLPFIPPIPAQPEKTNAGGNGAAVAAAAAAPAICPSVQACFGALVDRLNTIENFKTATVNRVIVQITADVNRAKDDVEAIVSASDSILTSGGGVPALIGQLDPILGAGGAPGSVNTALSRSWPDTNIESLLGQLNVLKNDLLSLPTTPVADATSFDTWYQSPGNKNSYDAARARIDVLQTQLGGLKSSSTQGSAFLAAQGKLRLWKPILISVRDGGPAGFNQIVRVGCGFAFEGTKETKVKIVKRDRLADPGAATTSEEVVTVVCSSPLSVSAGFGFSNVDEREFVFVPSTKTTTVDGQTTQTVISRFGFRNKSGFRTLPVLLLNTRIWEPNDTLALHLSTGAAVDIKTGEGGTDLEYIVGPSMSFRRSFFITPGLHIGRVPKLAGGFSLDEEVPTGISEPPVEKTWKKGFVVTFTYKIR